MNKQQLSKYAEYLASVENASECLGILVDQLNFEVDYEDEAAAEQIINVLSSDARTRRLEEASLTQTNTSKYASIAGSLSAQVNLTSTAFKSLAVLLRHIAIYQTKNHKVAHPNQHKEDDQESSIQAPNSDTTRLIGWGRLPQVNGTVLTTPGLLDNRDEEGSGGRINVKRIACSGHRG